MAVLEPQQGRVAGLALAHGVPILGPVLTRTGLAVAQAQDTTSCDRRGAPLSSTSRGAICSAEAAAVRSFSARTCASSGGWPVSADAHAVLTIRHCGIETYETALCVVDDENLAQHAVVSNA